MKKGRRTRRRCLECGQMVENVNPAATGITCSDCVYTICNSPVPPEKRRGVGREEPRILMD